jgi:hypothetical protein
MAAEIAAVAVATSARVSALAKFSPIRVRFFTLR